MRLLLRSLIPAALLVLALPAFAQEGAEAKLRETLRNTMLQLRDVQGKNALLEAQLAAKTSEAADLQTRLDEAFKQMATDKDTTDRAIALLQSRSEELEAELGRARVSLENWKAAHQKAAALAKKTELERAKLSKEKADLDRVAADYRSKNIELHALGMEILERYRRHSLGDAVLAKEPFMGTMRARYQSLTQDFADKLADNRIRE